MSDKINIVSIQTPRRAWVFPIFGVGIAVAFIMAFFAVTGPYFFIDYEFNAVTWRTQINKRPGMVNALLEELEGKNYSREQLLDMLGESGLEKRPRASNVLEFGGL
ncbi:hypothetical protein [Bradymonas sediminis]|nr:hypothetical protein [Bradymonas sediminis]